jgi:hypothetical protein
MKRGRAIKNRFEYCGNVSLRGNSPVAKAIFKIRRVLRQRFCGRSCAGIGKPAGVRRVKNQGRRLGQGWRFLPGEPVWGK